MTSSFSLGVCTLTPETRRREGRDPLFYPGRGVGRKNGMTDQTEADKDRTRKQRGPVRQSASRWFGPSTFEERRRKKRELDRSACLPCVGEYVVDNGRTQRISLSFALLSMGRPFFFLLSAKALETCSPSLVSWCTYTPVSVLQCQRSRLAFCASLPLGPCTTDLSIRLSFLCFPRMPALLLSSLTRSPLSLALSSSAPAFLPGVRFSFSFSVTHISSSSTQIN